MNPNSYLVLQRSLKTIMSNYSRQNKKQTKTVKKLARLAITSRKVYLLFRKP
ncbi:hypothetical protein HMPREF9954_0807 [Streptococcus infantis SK970]|nr:hypothetical protein HMPREF9954_0807 [Streptococcus infantis SK970]